MRISLVVSTIGRRAVELRRLLVSLEAQSHKDFEVIVVDQNQDAGLAPIVAEFAEKLEIRHLTRASTGVSRGRNSGICETTGEVTCFPDDDCWYPEQFLRDVNDLLTAHPEWDAIIGEAVDESGRPVLPWRDRSQRATRPICWRRAVCFALVLRSRVLANLGEFDETCGPGAGTMWGSGEDIGLMLRAVENGFHVRYEKGLRIHHPKIFRSFDKSGRSKGYGYALGDGRQLREHPMPLWWRMLFFGVPFGRTLLAMAKLAGEEARFHWAICVGRVQGFRLSG